MEVGRGSANDGGRLLIKLGRGWFRYRWERISGKGQGREGEGEGRGMDEREGGVGEGKWFASLIVKCKRAIPSLGSAAARHALQAQR